MVVMNILISIISLTILITNIVSQCGMVPYEYQSHTNQLIVSWMALINSLADIGLAFVIIDLITQEAKRKEYMDDLNTFLSMFRKKKQ